MMTENQIGRWAVCGAGKVGRIDRIDQTPTGPLWSGVSIEGTPWQSKTPALLQYSQGNALAQCLEAK